MDLIARAGVVTALAMTMVATALPVAPAAAQDEGMDISGMTPRQQLDYAEETVNEVKGSVRKVLKMVEQAQKDKDPLLLNCLNEKLAGLKALLKVAEDADLAMQEAMARENNDLANHELQKLVMAREQGSTLLAEADACVPEVGVSYAGRGRWSVEQPDQPEDESQYDSDVEGYDRPPEASPFT